MHVSCIFLRAFADNHRRQLQPAGLGDGQVVLAEVYAVGPGGSGDINAVVDDAEHAAVAAEPDEFAGNGKKHVILDALGPQLNTVGLAGDAELGQ